MTELKFRTISSSVTAVVRSLLQWSIAGQAQVPRGYFNVASSPTRMLLGGEQKPKKPTQTWGEYA